MTVNLKSEEYERYKQELKKKQSEGPSNNPEPREPKRASCRFLGKIEDVVRDNESDAESTSHTDLVSYRGLPGFGSIKNWTFSTKK